MLQTEQRNSKTTHIDKMSTMEMLQIMNEENRNSVAAVEAALPSVERAVECITEAFQKGGRLFYMGAGTSGRLAVVDASECPPTFGVDPGLVNGIIAGGLNAMVRASEGKEDSGEAGVEDLIAHQLTAKDVVVGISAAGGAAYVAEAMKAAQEIGCKTISITCNEGSLLDQLADISIVTKTGPEVITGSTRLKAGNAQKMVLNMLSTCTMVKTGKVYENMMINLKPTNKKLAKRMIGIVMEITGADADKAEQLLEQNEWSIRKVLEQ